MPTPVCVPRQRSKIIPEILTRSFSQIQEGLCRTRLCQRVCMKGFSQFWMSVGDKGQSLSEVVLAHGGLEVGK